MQSSPAPNINACNVKGESVQDLAAAAMSLESDASSDSPNQNAQQHKRQRTDRSDSEHELDEESEWQARLMEESGAELRGHDEDEWDRFLIMLSLFAQAVLVAQLVSFLVMSMLTPETHPSA